MLHIRLVLPLLLAAGLAACSAVSPSKAADRPAPATRPATWISDNGNGSYTNPLFYEEFSDPDVIRVGTDYYLTGTTMHAMPGLPVLHSKDLVNWELASYCFDRLELDPTPPQFRLENHKEQYGQGIWAPCIRYHDGTFYIFSNVNGQGTHVYRSRNPRGPWQHNKLATTLYDLSVLFDDDGKIYVCHGINPIYLSELNAELTDVVPNTRRELIPRNSGMGEGLHFYKIKGRYYIVSAIPGAHTPLVCARADALKGPWTVETLVTGEHLGVHTGNAARNSGRGPNLTFGYQDRDPNTNGGLTIHQGGIVDTPSGQWWAVLMQDHRSLGRLSNLVPITWDNDWPFIGLPGNLRKAPRSWIKPDTGHVQPPTATWTRNDSFDTPTLQPLWQWNHLPDDTRWSLTEKPGVLRLHSLPADTFWWARNTLTQRAIGPESTVTVELDVAGMQPGDTAGLALLNQPYAWIGVVKTEQGLALQQFDELTRKFPSLPVTGTRFWLRAACNFDSEKATFSYSTDGRRFEPFGDAFTMIFQLKTFQGVRYSLFHFNTAGKPGGHVDFDNYTVDEPRHLSPLPPVGKTITLSSVADGSVLIARNNTLESVPAADPAASSPAARFRVEGGNNGGVTLRSVPDNTFVHVVLDNGAPRLTLGPGVTPMQSQLFQWVPMQFGDIQLMSHINHRYLAVPKNKPGPATASTPVTTPDHKDGSCFTFHIVAE